MQPVAYSGNHNELFFVALVTTIERGPMMNFPVNLSRLSCISNSLALVHFSLAIFCQYVR